MGELSNKQKLLSFAKDGVFLSKATASVDAKYECESMAEANSRIEGGLAKVGLQIYLTQDDNSDPTNPFTKGLYVLESAPNIASNSAVGAVWSPAGTNTEYQLSMAGNSIQLVDSNGFVQTIVIPNEDTNTTYTLSSSGNTVTLTDSDGNTQSISVNNEDTDTTYSLALINDNIVLTDSNGNQNVIHIDSSDSQEIYYIDPINGVDSTGDGSAEKPFKTLAAAVPLFEDNSSVKTIVILGNGTLSHNVNALKLPKYHYRFYSVNGRLDFSCDDGNDESIYSSQVTSVSDKPLLFDAKMDNGEIIFYNSHLYHNEKIIFKAKAQEINFEWCQIDLFSFEVECDKTWVEGFFKQVNTIKENSYFKANHMETYGFANDILDGTDNFTLPPKILFDFGKINYGGNDNFSFLNRTECPVDVIIRREIKITPSVNTNPLVTNTPKTDGVPNPTEDGLVSWYFMNATIDGNAEFKGVADIYGHLIHKGANTGSLFNCIDNRVMRFFNGSVTSENNRTLFVTKGGKSYEFNNFNAKFQNTIQATNCYFFKANNTSDYSIPLATFNGSCNFYTDNQRSIINYVGGLNENATFIVNGHLGGNVIMESHSGDPIDVIDNGSPDVLDLGISVRDENNLERFRLAKNENVIFEGFEFSNLNGQKKVKAVSSTLDFGYHLFVKYNGSFNWNATGTIDNPFSTTQQAIDSLPDNQLSIAYSIHVLDERTQFISDVKNRNIVVHCGTNSVVVEDENNSNFGKKLVIIGSAQAGTCSFKAFNGNLTIERFPLVYFSEPSLATSHQGLMYLSIKNCKEIWHTPQSQNLNITFKGTVEVDKYMLLHNHGFNPTLDWEDLEMSLPPYIRCNEFYISGYEKNVVVRKLAKTVVEADFIVFNQRSSGVTRYPCYFDFMGKLELRAKQFTMTYGNPFVNCLFRGTSMVSTSSNPQTAIAQNKFVNCSIQLHKINAAFSDPGEPMYFKLLLERLKTSHFSEDPHNRALGAKANSGLIFQDTKVVVEISPNETSFPLVRADEANHNEGSYTLLSVLGTNMFYTHEQRSLIDHTQLKMFSIFNAKNIQRTVYTANESRSDWNRFSEQGSNVDTNVNITPLTLGGI